MKVKRYARADREACAACGACLNECPRGAIEIWRGCYASVEAERCAGCGRCAMSCPAGAMKILTRED